MADNTVVFVAGSGGVYPGLHCLREKIKNTRPFCSGCVFTCGEGLGTRLRWSVARATTSRGMHVTLCAITDVFLWEMEYQLSCLLSAEDFLCLCVLLELKFIKSLGSPLNHMHAKSETDCMLG